MIARSNQTDRAMAARVVPVPSGAPAAQPPLCAEHVRRSRLLLELAVAPVKPGAKVFDGGRPAQGRLLERMLELTEKRGCWASIALGPSCGAPPVVAVDPIPTGASEATGGHRSRPSPRDPRTVWL